MKITLANKNIQIEISTKVKHDITENTTHSPKIIKIPIKVIMRKRKKRHHPTIIIKMITIVNIRTTMLSIKRSRGTITNPNQFMKKADKKVNAPAIIAIITAGTKIIANIVASGITKDGNYSKYNPPYNWA